MLTALIIVILAGIGIYIIDRINEPHRAYKTCFECGARYTTRLHLSYAFWKKTGEFRYWKKIFACPKCVHDMY